MRTKTNIIQVTGVVSVLLILASCTSITTGTHYDKEHFFKQHKTFGWIAKDPVIMRNEAAITMSPMTQKSIVTSIQHVLESKGYRYIEEHERADFVLSYTVGSREKFSVSTTSIPTVYRRNRWDWYWHGDSHEINSWHIQSWTEGTLMIDMFDNTSKQPVWHGWATKIITGSDRQQPDKPIHKAVEKIFKDFPSMY